MKKIIVDGHTFTKDNIVAIDALSDAKDHKPYEYLYIVQMLTHTGFGYLRNFFIKTAYDDTPLILPGYTIEYFDSDKGG